MFFQQLAGALLATGLALAGGVALGEWLTTALSRDVERGGSMITIGDDSS